MRTVLQVAFGLLLAVTGLAALAFLGVLIKDRPDWRTGAWLLAILAVGQAVAKLVFRREIALQVLIGLITCVMIATALIYTRLSFFWEPRYPDGSTPITWRSGVMFVILVAISQFASSAIFKGVRRNRQ